MNTSDNTNMAGENANVNAAPGNPVPPIAPGIGIDPVAPAPPPTKKETSLREFLGKMDEYAPIVSLHHLPQGHHTINAHQDQD